MAKGIGIHFLGLKTFLDVIEKTFWPYEHFKEVSKGFLVILFAFNFSEHYNDRLPGVLERYSTL